MSSPDISSLGEAALIARLRARVRPAPPHVIIGIGDDAAAMEPGRGTVEVVTTDALVENVHFRRAWTGAAAIGHKALAVNLSDLAAMGATPRAVLLSLMLPADFPVADFDALLDGFLTLADATGVPLIGGNLTGSPGPLVADVTAIGAAKRRRLLRRSTARPGDELYVTGTLGGAAAGLGLLRAGERAADLEPDLAACVERYERPTPRLRLGSIAARTGAASAGIDLSDGLSAAVHQLAEASGTGAVIDADVVPIDKGASRWAANAGHDPLTIALQGGEDYELLFAVSPRQRRKFLAAAARTAGVPVTRIGRLTAEPGAWIEREATRQPLPRGFDHF